MSDNQLPPLTKLLSSDARLGSLPTREHSSQSMTDRIHSVIDENARLELASVALSDATSLYHAGMTSLASVSLMLALEEEFGIGFPDHMIRREVFETISSIREALAFLIALPS